MYQYGCSMFYGVNTKGLKGSVEYIEKKMQAMGHFDTRPIEMLQCSKVSEVYNPKLRNLNNVVATCEIIAAKADWIIKNGEVPLFITGDHSAAIGSVSASSNNYDNLGLVWIDAHPDINTDKTTTTGNIHGMPIAAMLGMGEDKLTKILNDKKKLRPEKIIMFGLRDIDPPEQIFLDKLNIRYYTYYDMERKGIRQCLEEARLHLGKINIHVSIDIDSMDPEIIPGVSVPVPGGFNITEMNYLIFYIKNYMNVCAWDIVEFNHRLDRDDVTADFVLRLVDWINEKMRSIEYA